MNYRKEWVSDFITVPELRDRWRCDDGLIEHFYCKTHRSGCSQEEFESLGARALRPYGDFFAYEIHTVRFDDHNKRWGFASLHEHMWFIGDDLRTEKWALPLDVVIAYECDNKMLSMSCSPEHSIDSLLSAIKEKDKHIENLTHEISRLVNESSSRVARASEKRSQNTVEKWSKYLEQAAILALNCVSSNKPLSFKEHNRLWKQFFGAEPVREALRALRRALPDSLVKGPRA